MTTSRLGSGCLVACAPHRTWLEPFLLLAAWPEDAARLVWLADGTTVTRSWWRRRLLPRLGILPIERRAGGPGAYLEAAAAALAAGAALVVFPEKGPPSPPDRTRTIAPGFAYLARRAGARTCPWWWPAATRSCAASSSVSRSSKRCRPAPRTPRPCRSPHGRSHMPWPSMWGGRTVSSRAAMRRPTHSSRGCALALAGRPLPLTAGRSVARPAITGSPTGRAPP